MPRLATMVTEAGRRFINLMAREDFKCWRP
jgi:hypothetical protein